LNLSKDPKLSIGVDTRGSSGYLDLKVDEAEIKKTIYEHPKQMIAKLSENLLEHYRPHGDVSILHSRLSILNSYDIYQHLLDYRSATMQDDCYAISSERVSKMTLSVHPGADRGQRQDILERWYSEQVRSEVPKLIDQWEKHLGVTVKRFFVQRMKTRAGEL
jgi:predicted metal-dependent hydrolase